MIPAAVFKNECNEDTTDNYIYITLKRCEGCKITLIFLLFLHSHDYFVCHSLMQFFLNLLFGPQHILYIREIPGVQTKCHK